MPSIVDAIMGKKAAPVEEVAVEEDMPMEGDGLDMAAQDLIDAVKSGDAAMVASALRAAFDIMESEPHEEAPHPEMGEEEIE